MYGLLDNTNRGTLMLETIHLKNVGQAAEMEMQLTDRLNI